MNGVSGRMGYRQHLVRSILAIRDQGGIAARRRLDACTVEPHPRRPQRGQARRARRQARHRGLHDRPRRGPRRPALGDLRRLPRHEGARLGPPQGDRRRQDDLHREAHGRDASTRRSSSRSSPRRPASRPASCTTSSTCRACRSSSASSTPASSAASCRVRGEFGYWVFEGDWQPAQRPSWNYRAEDGGGIIVDMFPHWNYVLENLFGEVKTRLRAGRHPHPRPLGRERRALHRHRRRRRVRHLRARGRRRRADQLLLDRPRQPRRARRVPRRRHARLRRRRAVRREDPAPQRHPEAGLEPRPRRRPRLRRRLGRGARRTTCSRTASSSSGRSSSATSSRAPTTSSTCSPAPAACCWPRPASQSSREGRTRCRAAVTSLHPPGELTGAMTMTRSPSSTPPARVIAGRSCAEAPGVHRSRPAPLRSRVAYAAAHVVPKALGRQHPGRARRGRLGRDARVPPRRVLVGPRRRRRHGHRAAQHGPGCRRHPRADRPQCAEVAREEGGSVVVGVNTDHVEEESISLDAVIDAYKEQLHFTEEQGAGAVLMASRHLARAATHRPTTTAACTARCSPRRRARSCCTGSAPPSTRRSRATSAPTTARRHRRPARDHRGERRQGRGRQDEPAGCRRRGLGARAPARGRAHVHRRRLQLRRPHRGRRARPLRRAARRVRRDHAGRLGGDPGARRRRLARYREILGPTEELAGRSSPRRPSTTRPASRSCPGSTATRPRSRWSAACTRPAACRTCSRIVELGRTRPARSSAPTSPPSAGTATAAPERESRTHCGRTTPAVEPADGGLA